MNTNRIYDNKKVIWIISILIVLASVGGSVYVWDKLLASHAEEQEQMRVQVEKRAQVSAIALEQYMEMVVLSIDNTLRQLRAAYLSNPEQFDTIVRETLQNLPPDMVRFVVVFGADGTLRYSSNGITSKQLNFKDREHFRVHAESQGDHLFISQPISGRLTGMTLIQMTRPIWTKDGRFIGVIGLPLRPDFVAKQLQDLHIGQEDTMAVMRTDGSFVSHSKNLARALQTTVRADRPFLHAPAGSNGLLRDTCAVEHKPMLFAWRRMKRLPLLVMVAIDEEPQNKLMQSNHAIERLDTGAGITILLGFAGSIVLLLHFSLRRNQALSRSENLLRAERQRMEDILEGTHVGTWEWNIPTGTLIVNRYWAEMVGYTLEELAPITSQTWEQLLHPDDLQYSDQVLQKHFTGEFPYYECEIRMQHRHKHWVWILIRGKVAARDLDGSPRLMSGTHQDITARKQALFALENANALLQTRSAEAEAANRAKSTFLATMSHEIRTPLNAIIGMGYLLEHSSLDAQQHEYVRAIQVSSKNLLALVNDVLDVSKIEAGELVLESVPIFLPALCDEMLLLFATTAQNKGLAFNIQALPHHLPTTIEGDEVRIRQMLLNLLGNALKFTAQGSIELIIQSTSSTTSTQGERLRFAVHDTGIGVAPEQQGKLFRPFSQADTSTTRKYGGTGLGLSIVRQLAERMGGIAGFTSQLGVGSTFWFEIPLKPSTTTLYALHKTQTHHPDDEVEISTVSAAPAGCLHGMHILVVDDSPMNREVCDHILRAQGASTALAESGQAALHRLRSHPDAYAAILMDIQMPEMDGIETTRQIRKEPCWKSLPIIALTAGAITEGRQQALDAGMNVFLTKPIDPPQLLRALQRHIQHPPSRPLIPVPEKPALSPSTSSSTSSTSINQENQWPLIAGIETYTAQKRLQDDLPLFTRLLHYFVTEIPVMKGQITQLLTTEKWSEIAAVLHKMRGMLGNIGAELAFAQATQAEDAIKQTHSTAPLTALYTTLDALVTAIQLWLEQVPQLQPLQPPLQQTQLLPPSMVQIESLTQQITELETLLAENRIDAIATAQSIQVLLAGTAYATGYQQVVETISTLQYAQALEKLAMFKDSIR